MPPKAKKRRVASSTSCFASASITGNTQEVSKLVQWLPREKLEALVQRSVVEQVPLTIGDLKQSMSENERWRFKVPSKMNKGEERVGTGAFDYIDANTMGLIFAHLNVRDCITCVTSVCKAWRNFKTLPGLFLDLSDNSLATVQKSGYRTKAARVKCLLDWVPNPGNVTGLRISTADSCSPNECKAIIKVVADVKKRAGKAVDLTNLVLTGPKIYDSVVREAMKKGIGPSLSSLTIADVKNTAGSKMGKGCLCDFLKTCPRLEELYVTQSLVAQPSLQLHLQALRCARAGATTLLRVLDLTTKGWSYLSLKWDDIADIGSSCPELEVLKLEIVTGTPTSPPGCPSSMPVTFLSDPMTTLPRLKVFSLDRIVKEYSFNKQPEYASSDTVAHILSWLFDALPVIEDFSFVHGEMGMTRKDRRLYAVPTLPGLGNPSWPRTLRKLHLRSLNLEPNALAAADLPALEKATLELCGPSMIAVIQGLYRRHEHLNVGVWKHEGYGDSYSRNGGIRATCVASRLDGKFEESP